MLNSFRDLYKAAALRYFAFPECRRHSRAFYKSLLHCARRGDGPSAEILSRRVMLQSMALWKKLEKG